MHSAKTSWHVLLILLFIFAFKLEHLLFFYRVNVVLWTMMPFGEGQTNTVLDS